MTKLFRDHPGITLRHFQSKRSLGVLPSSYSDEVFEAAARFIFDRRGKYDLITLSGDVATIGTAESVTAAYEAIDSDYYVGYVTARSFATLGGDPQRIFLMPGNHDRYRNVLGDTGATEFNETFKKYWEAPKSVKVRVLEKDGDHLAIVAADFCLRSDEEASGTHRLGRGKVHTDILDSLVLETERVRKKYANMATIWMVHFPPTGTPSELQLIDGHRLEAAASRLEVPLIIAGHIHESKILYSQYGTPIVCAGSLCAVEDDGHNCAHLLDVATSKNKITSVNKSDFAWSDDVDDFVMSSQHVF